MKLIMNKKKRAQHAYAKEVSDRKFSIMEAAIKVFAQKSFHGATTLEIAKEAGVSEGTVFKYFETKRNLLLSIAAPRMVSSIFENLMADEGDGSERIKSFVFKQFQSMKSNSQLVKLLLYESLFDDELKDNVIETIFQEVMKVLTSFYREQVDQDVFRNLRPEVAVFCLAGMLAFYLTWQELLGGKEYTFIEEEEMLDGIVQIFLTGVVKR